MPSRLTLHRTSGTYTAEAFKDALLVVVFALVFRAAFAFAISGTYDYDEFVILLLGRDSAHGLVPYRDFMFFHPPGILVMLRPLEPLLAAWWPLGRMLSVACDTATAALVWLIGRRLFERRTALVAGLLYAVNPLALVAAARVGQDPVITMLGTAGLALLVTHPSRIGALTAGICLGLAIWVKYPAAFFIPVYVLVAPRRAAISLPAAAVVVALGLAPFHSELSQLYSQTVTFQRNRWAMPLSTRMQTLGLYWVTVNALGFAGLFLIRRPLWLPAGLLLGGLFALSSQVYYHYFALIVPFGCLLGAPVVIRAARLSASLVLVSGAILAGLLALIINLGGPSPLFITAAHLRWVNPTVSILDRVTTPTDPVLADRYEYAYLANRPALAHYFWNVGVLVRAPYLERQLTPGGAVVLSTGASSGYPPGFIRYVDARFRHRSTGRTTIWLLRPVGTTAARRE